MERTRINCFRLIIVILIIFTPVNPASSQNNETIVRISKIRINGAKSVSKKEIKEKTNVYLKYSGIGIQLIAIVALGSFAGVKLDKHFPVASFPLFTVVLTFLAIGAAMYFLFKEAMRK